LLLTAKITRVILRRITKQWKPTQQTISNMNRSSSFFNRARTSFFRSGGNRGASIEVLRGNNGADFEATAIVNHIESNCLCSTGGGRGGGSKNMLVLMKGPFIFVFPSDVETTGTPEYAISLLDLHAEITPSSTNGSHHPVILKKSVVEDDFAYEFVFMTVQDATKFQTCVERQSKSAQTNEIRKNIGHAHLVQRTKSIRYAETIAIKKVSNQPEKPVKMTSAFSDAITNNAAMTPL